MHENSSTGGPKEEEATEGSDGVLQAAQVSGAHSYYGNAKTK